MKDYLTYQHDEKDQGIMRMLEICWWNKRRCCCFWG